MTSVKKTNTQTNPGNYGEHTIAGAVGASIGAVATAAAVGAVEGAAVGTAAGLPGMAAGIAFGAIAGGLAGKGIAQMSQPNAEEIYWRDQHKKQAYFDSVESYDSYAPAYRFGIEAYTTYAGIDFDKIEPQLGNQWEEARGTSRLTWTTAKLATRDAYERLCKNNK